MSGFAGRWLIGVTCAALIGALADSVMPKGAVRQVGKLTCTLVLLLAILRPVLSIQSRDIIDGLDGLEMQGGGQQQLSDRSNDLLKTIIERRSAAYIVDKAAQLGADIRAEVTCTQGEGGVWVPFSVQIGGSLCGEEREKLGKLVSEELAIPTERQVWTGGD